MKKKHAVVTESLPKICLTCALRKLAGKEDRPCGSCLLLNVDPLAKIKALAAKTSALARFPMMLTSGRAQIPAHSRRKSIG